MKDLINHTHSKNLQYIQFIGYISDFDQDGAEHFVLTCNIT